MQIRNNNEEWVEFKKQLTDVLKILESESEHYEFSEEPNRFDLSVNGCPVDPLFIKKENFLKLEYDFTLCNTSIRMIGLYMYTNKNFRIDISMK